MVFKLKMDFDILNYINSIQNSSSSNNDIVDPFGAFLKECEELESQCPNLDLVRRHIKAFRLGMPPVPDCEINYELGYVYDPQFRAKYWLHKFGYGSLEQCDFNKESKATLAHVGRPNRLVGVSKQYFLMECRGYCEEPWKFVEAYKDNKDEIEWIAGNVAYQSDFLLLMKCCKEKDWKPYIRRHANLIKSNVGREKRLNRGFICPNFAVDPDYEDKIVEYMKNYFRVQVLEQLIWTILPYDAKRWVYTYESDFIEIRNSGTEKYTKMASIKLPIYKVVSKRFMDWEEIWNELVNVGPNKIYESTCFGARPDNWQQEFYEKHVRVWDPKKRPELMLREIGMIQCGLEINRFWCTFGQHGAGARTCFELYIHWQRGCMCDSKHEPMN